MIELDHEYFSTLGPKQAYWAGVLAADGNVEQPKGKRINYQPQICLGVCDEYLPSKLAEDIGYSGSVKCRVLAPPRQPKYILRFSSQPTADWLLKYYNITPDKSLTYLPPNIEHKLPFIKGLIDGDGCIRWDLWNQKRSASACPTFSIDCVCTILVANWIKDTVGGFVSGQLCKKGDPNTVKWLYRGKAALEVAQKICDSLPEYGLERKWGKVLRS